MGRAQLKYGAHRQVSRYSSKHTIPREDLHLPNTELCDRKVKVLFGTACLILCVFEQVCMVTEGHLFPLEMGNS